jgi:hypothetical protein
MLRVPRRVRGIGIASWPAARASVMNVSIGKMI